MKRRRTFVTGLLAAAIVALTLPTASTYVIDNWWADGDNVVMDNIFLPNDPWGTSAEPELAEWNEVDVTTNDHPFLISLEPQYSFGANDGDNSMGFLGEAGLNSEYGLSYASALAWTICWNKYWPPWDWGRIGECDMVLDVSLPWSLTPDDSNYFQSTVLHEAGHIRGLDHYNSFLSMQNSGVNKKLRGATLYMDDKEGVRQHASHVSEYDMAAYSKWHNGSTPQWMTTSPTTVRVGQTVNWNNLTVENRGTQAFGELRIGFYMSTNTTISTGDTLVNTGAWGSYGRFTASTFNWSGAVPTVTDCGTRYFGAIIDDNNAWAERYEGNNATVFVNGTPDPQAYSILLERDWLEPNDTLGTARSVTLPLSTGSASIDQDSDNDYYRLTLPYASRVDVTVSFTHASGDIDLQLLNSVGSVVSSSSGISNSETISTHVAAGTYYVRVYGYGSGSCNRYSIGASATPAPVSIAATDPDATEAGPTTGTFTVTRTGSTAAALTVYYSRGGTATSGVDYLALPGSVTIPAGFSSAPIVVTPIKDGVVEVETVSLTLTADAAYTVTAPVTATVTITDGPDLSVSTLTAPATGGAGKTITGSATTKNLGNGPAAVSITRVYFSLGNSTLETATDALIATLSVSVLPPGGTLASSFTYTIPASTPNGSHYFIAVSDATNLIAETKESNNKKTKLIKIGPDLTISTLTASTSTPLSGQTMTVSEATKNALTASPAGASITRVYLSVNKVLDETDILLSSREVALLSAGAVSGPYVHTVRLPKGVTGVRYLIVMADAGGVVPETSENNNEKVKLITIQ